MNCFKEEIIQQYIDGELSGNQSSDFDKHIDSCKECATKYEQQLEIANFVKREINTLTKAGAIVPNINEILGNDNTAAKPFLRKLIYLVSAASIVFATFLYINSKQNSIKINDEILITNDYYYDANKSIMEQDFEITITDIK